MKTTLRWAALLGGSVGLATFTLGMVVSKAMRQPESSVLKSEPVPEPVVPPLSSVAPALAPEWTQADLRTLPGRWVGAVFGDALPKGPAGGSIMPMGVRAVFEEVREGSKTPWNVTLWVPRQDHMTPETISMSCGFYKGLHESADAGDGVAFRTAYCRGYGLAAGASHATTIRLTVRGDGALRVQVGSWIDAVVVRP